MKPHLDVTYVLPIRRFTPVSVNEDLCRYLREVSAWVGAVIVVDGSSPEVFASLGVCLPSTAQHVAPDNGEGGKNGKAVGVRTGLRRARTTYAVIADDDVRYDATSFAAVVEALSGADIVRPQNYFAPLPWHAVLDEGRTLLARVTGGDWPGTLGIRMSAYRRAGGYDADALFENLELVRTICATGGRERRLDGIFVRRLPPTTRHFVNQRVRQAYDEFARPARLFAQLAAAPVAVALVRRYGMRAGILAGAVVVAAAELGRRRDGASRVFPLSASLFAPAWVVERSLTSWLAVLWRLGGGVPYAGHRIRLAANSPRVLRRRLAQRIAP